MRVTSKRLDMTPLTQHDWPLFQLLHNTPEVIAQCFDPVDDAVLQQKEYFSNYVFKDQIAEILAKDKKLSDEYQLRKATDEKFRNSEWDQLYFIYSRSPYFEQTFMRLPIYQKF